MRSKLIIFLLLLVIPITLWGQMSFTNTFEEAGFTDWTAVRQIICYDWNDDGFVDFIFPRHSDQGSMRLFLNDQDGTFTENNEQLGMLASIPALALSIGDIDNDGDDDIVVKQEDSFLILENNNGILTDITPENISNLGEGLMFLFDFENDGDLDLIFNGNNALTLLVNDNWIFTSTHLVNDIDGFDLADYNMDGLVDLIAVTQTSSWTLEPVIVLKNNQESGFSEVIGTGISPQTSYSPISFDYDNDGDFDFYHGTTDMVSNGVEKQWLFINNADFSFTDNSSCLPSVGSHYYYSATPGDPDFDGDIDLFCNIWAWTNSRFYENINGVYSDNSENCGLVAGGGRDNERGIWIDIDNDTDLDLFVSNLFMGHPVELAHGGWMLSNSGADGNYLIIKPVADTSNSSLYGTTTTVYWQGQAQVQDYNYPKVNSYNYMPQKYFGLGTATQADSVIVRWPSGIVTKLYDVAANQEIIIHENTAPLLDPPVLTMYEQPESRVLTWTNPADSIFVETCIFRGTEPGFALSEPHIITTDEFWIESHLNLFYYTACFRDSYGRLSEPSNEVMSQYPTEVQNLPSQLALRHNYPNPFNPRTTITYELPALMNVKLNVFDVAGQHIATLVDNRLEPGIRNVQWDGRSDAGVKMSSGAYFVRLTAGDKTETLKITLAK